MLSLYRSLHRLARRWPADTGIPVRDERAEAKRRAQGKPEEGIAHLRDHIAASTRKVRFR